MPSQNCELSRFVVNTRELVERKCVLLLISCYSDITGGEGISPVRHNGAVKRSFIRYMVTGVDIISGQKAWRWPLRDTWTGKEIILKIPKKNRASNETENEVAEEEK